MTLASSLSTTFSRVSPHRPSPAKSLSHVNHVDRACLWCIASNATILSLRPRVLHTLCTVGVIHLSGVSSTRGSRCMCPRLFGLDGNALEVCGAASPDRKAMELEGARRGRDQEWLGGFDGETEMHPAVVLPRGQET